MNRPQRLLVTVQTIFRSALFFLLLDRRRMQESFFDGFMQLGGVYVKFLQLSSLQAGVLDDIPHEKRLQVYDKVRPDELDLEAKLRSELGENVLTLFHSLESESFAAGSFGQVYRGVLHSGDKVAIKVLRPTLSRYLRFDLKVLRVLTFIMSPLLTKEGMVSMRDVYKDFKKVAIAETDYIKEAEATTFFYEKYKDHPHMVTPMIYHDLSSDEILTQTMLEGLPATELIAMHERGEDVEAFMFKEYNSDLVFVMRTLGFELFMSILTDSMAQGDPHPGNVQFLPNNQLALIDFGITSEPPRNSAAFVRLLNDYAEIYRGNFNAGEFMINIIEYYAPQFFSAIKVFDKIIAAETNFSIIEEVKKISENAIKEAVDVKDIERLVRQGKFTRIFNNTINKNNRFAIKVDFDGGVMLRAATTYTAFTNGLGIRDQMFPLLFDTIVETYNQHTAGAPTQKGGKNKEMKPEQALEIIANWVEDIQERDPVFFRGMITKFKEYSKNV